MQTYKLVYEVEELTLRKLFKQPFKALNGGKLTSITNKVLLRTKIINKSHKLAKLECSLIELQAIHLELKYKIEK